MSRELVLDCVAGESRRQELELGLMGEQEPSELVGGVQ